MAAMFDEGVGPPTRDAFAVGGIPEAKRKIAVFLERQTSSIEVEGSVVVELLHFGYGETEALSTWDFDPHGPNAEEEIRDLANLITEEASEDVEARGYGAQKYVVKIQKLAGQTIFRLVGPPRDNWDDDLAEGANEKGLVAQAMRHTEFMTRALAAGYADVMDQQRNMARELREENKSLRRREAGMMQAYENMLQATHLRDLEVKKMDRAEQRKDQVAGIIMSALPGISAKLLGKGTPAGATPSQPTPIESQIEAVFDTFRPEQLQQVMATGTLQLDDTQKMALFQLVSSLVEASEAREAAKSVAQSAPRNNDTKK